MAAPEETKAPALPQNMTREKHALLNLYSSNERLFAPLKESFFEWLETPEVRKDFGQMLEIIIDQVKKGTSAPCLLPLSLPSPRSLPNFCPLLISTMEQWDRDMFSSISSLSEV